MFSSLSRDKKGALEYINNYKPQTEGQQLRILLHGPVGAGKSSFINSVQSVLKGRMCTLALADNTTHGCFTKQVRRIFRTYINVFVFVVICSSVSFGSCHQSLLTTLSVCPFIFRTCNFQSAHQMSPEFLSVLLSICSSFLTSSLPVNLFKSLCLPLLSVTCVWIPVCLLVSQFWFTSPLRPRSLLIEWGTVGCQLFIL